MKSTHVLSKKFWNLLWFLCWKTPLGVACVNLQGAFEPPVLNVDPHPIAAGLFGFSPE